jgi:hypothetical protein
VVAVLVNLLAARHYRRWDWTREGLYTLSHVTDQTLSSLSAPVDVWVLSSTSEPITLTLRHLLTAYRSKSDKLVLHFIDPDTSPAELFAAQQKLGIVAGKSEGGRVVTDATVVIVKGDRKHYITAGDLVSVEQGAEMRVRPQVERVLTAGLREVLAGDPVQICFTTGHGEPLLDAGGEDGLLPLSQRLAKSNFKVVALPPLSEVHGKDPIAACAVVVVAAPKQRLNKTEVDRLRLYIDGGGNALIAAGPLPDEAEKGVVSLGLDPLLASVGLKQRQDFVFERDPARRAGSGQGEMFMAKLEKHAATEALMVGTDQVPIVVIQSSSLDTAPIAPAKPDPLLVTSERAFGMVDIAGWAASGKAPEPRASDARGPLAIAYAVELPKRTATAHHGPRVVALASSYFLAGRNWGVPELQGTALFVEGVISWLGAKTVVLDIPNKRARPIGLSITEEALKSVLVKVVVAMPLAVLFAGVAIRWRRQRTEAKSRHEPQNADDERASKDEPKSKRAAKARRGAKRE